MKKFCESLREHAVEMINFKKKKLKLLTKEQQESYKNEKIENKHVKDKKYCKVSDHCHYTEEYRVAVHNICNSKYSVPQKIPIAFHNGSTTQPAHHVESFRFDVDITSIRRRPNFGEFPRCFHVLFRCNFADRKIHVVSTHFFPCNFDGRKIHVISTYFFRCNFFCRDIHFICKYFFRQNFDEFDFVVGKL